MKIIYILILLISYITAFPQSDYYNKKNLRFDDFIYEDNISTVQLYKLGFEISSPIIELNSSERLILSFDDLKQESSTFSYTIILCNNDWQPADLLSMEYIEGMTEDFFSANNQSFSTRIPYIHYQLIFPNEQMKITKAGNYLLKVYKDGNPDNVVLTKRFYVFENKISINASVILPSTAQDRKTKQEMNLSLSLGTYSMPNIYENLAVYIQQNQRKDNSKVLTRPKSVSGNVINFNSQGDIMFDAGNEFRNFDTRSLKTYSQRIQKIETDSNGFHVQLLADGNRLSKNYLRYRDLNGKYAIISYDDTHFSSQYEGDYSWVTFTLPCSEPRSDGSIFVFGALTNWEINQNNRMNYNAQIGAYEAILFLKQGYYDYQYIFVANNAKIGEIGTFEGNFSETENDYTIFVYYREQGSMYDKLIGIQTINAKF